MILKKEYTISSEQEKIQHPRHLAKSSISRSGLGIFDIYTQFNYMKIKWIQRLLNPTNTF